VKPAAGFALGTLIGSAVAAAVAPPLWGARDGFEKRLRLGVRACVADAAARGKAVLDAARTALNQAVEEGRRAAAEQRALLQSQITR
jgi:hypothetical protein